MGFVVKPSFLYHSFEWNEATHLQIKSHENPRILLSLKFDRRTRKNWAILSCMPGLMLSEASVTLKILVTNSTKMVNHCWCPWGFGEFLKTLKGMSSWYRRWKIWTEWTDHTLFIQSPNLSLNEQSGPAVDRVRRQKVTRLAPRAS